MLYIKNIPIMKKTFKMMYPGPFECIGDWAFIHGCNEQDIGDDETRGSKQKYSADDRFGDDTLP